MSLKSRLKKAARFAKKSSRFLLEGLLALHIGSAAMYMTNDLYWKAKPSPVRQAFEQEFGFPLKGWYWDVELNPQNVESISRVIREEQQELTFDLSSFRIESSHYLLKNPIDQFGSLIARAYDGYYGLDRVVVLNTAGQSTLRHEIKHAKTFDYLAEHPTFKNKWKAIVNDDARTVNYRNPLAWFCGRLRGLDKLVSRWEGGFDALAKEGFISDYARTDFYEDVAELTTEMSDVARTTGINSTWYCLQDADAAHPLAAKVLLAEEAGIAPQGFLDYLRLDLALNSCSYGEYGYDIDKALPLLPRIEAFLEQHPDDLFTPTIAAARAEIIESDELRKTWLCNEPFAHDKVIEAYKNVLRASCRSGAQGQAIEALHRIAMCDDDRGRAAIYELVQEEYAQYWYTLKPGEHRVDRIRAFLVSFGEL